MISLPLVVVNCDRCPASLSISGWNTQQQVAEAIVANGWTLKQGDWAFVFCPICSCKQERING